MQFVPYVYHVGGADPEYQVCLNEPKDRAFLFVSNEASKQAAGHMQLTMGNPWDFSVWLTLWDGRPR